MTVTFAGLIWTLPPRGRLGYQIQSTLRSIIESPSPIALYSAMGLRGKAKSYEARYREAFIRFARVNSDKLREGNVGPRGGYGYGFAFKSETIPHFPTSIPL